MKLRYLACVLAVAAFPATAANISPVQNPGQVLSMSPSDRLYELLEQIPSAIDAACCKVCTKGQACGDSCISWNNTCHIGPGCACQAPGS